MLSRFARLAFRAARPGTPVLPIPLFHSLSPVLAHLPPLPTSTSPRLFRSTAASDPLGDPLPHKLVHSDLASHPSTRKLLAWSSSPSAKKGARSVEIIHRREWDDEPSSEGEDGGVWRVEVWCQDLAARSVELQRGEVKAEAVNECVDDALTEAAEEALDLIKAAEKEND
ncbi:hypothetical protein JCM8097_004936 [Rhodosporidiobolus ruineniae]